MNYFYFKVNKNIPENIKNNNNFIYNKINKIKKNLL